ncbi:MAG: hypothetical protein LBJ63_06275 [Prevotellaceae bacterium]|jgi:hypothetical protein|nr:hypothetical protein [Prevotellaceae bacterium]
MTKYAYYQDSETDVRLCSILTARARLRAGKKSGKTGAHAWIEYYDNGVFCKCTQIVLMK